MKPKHPKAPKTYRGWMAWNYEIPVIVSLRDTRRECWEAISHGCIDRKNFTVRRVTVTAA